MWASLGSSCLGLSTLPGLICLFLLPGFPSLCLQIGFQFLALSLLLLVPNVENVDMLDIVPGAP